LRAASRKREDDRKNDCNPHSVTSFLTCLGRD
jgi:hypothetical protein